ncbi:twitching motility protein PilT [Mycobacterium asiaticum]|uniref:Twitching motility protein PilT n=1 Tax=Mycobacterium asiaticum TaxID=1790 RepID=A0A1A3P186_MYCAS|nr:PIN domain-containing protein [Mycobacterium asiaticum]OBK27435.1 twitching motility protein PilT [Mycobacterium asiaticum]
MIILDASVLIGHFEPADAHHVGATALLKAHAMASFAASVVTLAEVYIGPARAGRTEQLDRLLTQLQVESLELPAGAARRLGELRATTKLSMPHCCVLYSAEQRNTMVATFDGKLAARAVDLGLSVAKV